ncbi:MAG: hypothetical protein IKO41_00460 [Lachnospiraceae bacterium]|nr:hypothetical protein [Lachnospiraceae bacterium]
MSQSINKTAEKKVKLYKGKFKRAYIHCTKDEYKKILEMQQETPLSMSEFVKRSLLGKKIYTYKDAEYYKALICLNSDLGRIGGLMKALLTNKEKFSGIYGQRVVSKINKILLEISEVKEMARQYNLKQNFLR